MSVEADVIDEVFTEIAKQILDDDPNNYHHHTRVNELTFIKAQDNGIEVEALCGFRKPPDKQNPLRKPCCPKCRQLMRAQCLGEFYTPND